MPWGWCTGQSKVLLNSAANWEHCLYKNLPWKFDLNITAFAGSFYLQNDRSAKLDKNLDLYLDKVVLETGE